jgi:hypothetical protein
MLGCCMSENLCILGGKFLEFVFFFFQVGSKVYCKPH